MLLFGQVLCPCIGAPSSGTMESEETFARMRVVAAREMDGAGDHAIATPEAAASSLSAVAAEPIEGEDRRSLSNVTELLDDLPLAQVGQAPGLELELCSASPPLAQATAEEPALAANILPHALV